MKNFSPLISVIIPSYNRTGTLSLLLKKLIAQTIFHEIEIIIVDQNRAGFLKENIPKSLLSSAKIIRQKRPNVSAARNIGAMESKGEVLFFVDDDLEPVSTFLERGYNIIKNNEIKCLIPLVFNRLGKLQELENIKRLTIKNISGELKLISESISAAIFFDRESFFQTGGFDPLLFDYVRSTEDQEFFLRTRKRGIQIYFNSSLSIFHSEEIKGGCDLRSTNYLINREKFIKGWSYRYRIHNGGNLSLKPWDIVNIFRSSFLNSEILTRNFYLTFSLFKFAFNAISDSENVLKEFKAHYSELDKVNHFKLVDRYI